MVLSINMTSSFVHKFGYLPKIMSPIYKYAKYNWISDTEIIEPAIRRAANNIKRD